MVRRPLPSFLQLAPKDRELLPIGLGAVGLSATYGVAVMAGLPQFTSFVPIAITGAVGGLVFTRLLKLRRAHRQAAAGEIKALEPAKFEEFIAQKIREFSGWRVEFLPKTESAASVVIAVAPGNVRFVLRLERVVPRLSSQIVQETLHTKTQYKAKHAVIVHFGDASASAEALMAEHAVRRWNLDRVIALQRAAVSKVGLERLFDAV